MERIVQNGGQGTATPHGGFRPQSADWNRKSRFGGLLAASLAGVSPLSVSAYDVTENFSLGGTVTGVLQHGTFSGTAIPDTGRGALVTDIGMNFRPTDRDTFESVVSLATGDALNTVSPYAAHPLYADDLEDNLEDVNGRGRDYLLTAWYKHTFALPRNASLGITGGILDAADYVDENSLANDEVSQFMNDAFVNNTLLVPPAFDAGIAGELEMGRWSLKGVWINGRNVDPDNGLDEDYDYFAGQLGWRTESRWGEGNYRLLAQGTSDDFADPTGAKTWGLFSVGLSADQQLSAAVGVFARLAWQDDDAAIDHDALYSGGVRVDGGLWGRVDDEVALGYAHLDGGNGEIEKTDILEGYVKFQLTEYADLSLDVQYLDERTTGVNDPSGFVYGMRINGYF
uniref:Porin n=1 Tax=Candidatus Kentrum sp. DK TaxID=2126562 RepID=A0A450T0N4_9GAMM|nr:MAG: porin [Candidatus Kentron sp. DK]